MKHFFGEEEEKRLTVEEFQKFHRQLTMEILKLEVTSGNHKGMSQGPKITTWYWGGGRLCEQSIPLPSNSSYKKKYIPLEHKLRMSA